MNRRYFLRNGLFVAAPFLLLPSKVWSQNAKIGIAKLGIVGGAPGTSGGGGPNVWYDTELFAATDTSASSSSTEWDWSDIVVTTGGSCTKCRIYIAGITSSTTSHLNAALFNNAGNSRLAVSSSDVTITDTGHDQYWEITWSVAATVNNSTTYKLAWAADSGDLSYRYKSGEGSNLWYAATSQTYGAFPPTSLPAPTFNLARGYAVGIWVQ